MADSSSTRSLWVTVGAGVATILVVLGVAAGPAAVSCFGSEAGFGGCVRDRLSQTGILGPQSDEVTTPTEMVADVEEVMPATSDVETPATPQAAVAGDDGEQANEDSNEPLAAAEAEATIPPRLGLVRAEPDGSLVIAGSAAPGDEVEIYASGEVLGRVTAEPSGDWVFVPDAPLTPGGAEISIAVPETGLLAEQSVVVVVQDDLETEPLVVASTPGQASQILQGLSAPTELEPVATPDEVIADDAVVISAINDAPLEPLPADPPLVNDTAGSAQEISDSADTEAPTPDDAQQSETVEIAVVDPVTEPDTAQEQTPLVTSIPPTIDAIEVDGERNFFAGGGTEGATIRLYVDDGFVADTIVQDGRWLVETDENYLTAPNQRVRIDMLRDNSAEVVARAEVNFEIDLQAVDEEAPIVVVEQSPPAQAGNDTAAEIAVAGEPEVRLDAPQLELPDAPPPISVVDTETEVASDLDTQTPIADGEELPTLTAVQVGDAEDQRFASGKAIIRSGDNLWTIASRVYGSGDRFTTIYQANRQQIRDPNLIYPGQVFNLPETE